MGYFDKLVKKSGNDFGSRLVEDELDANVPFVDTGSLSLNAALSGSIYGGAPGNRVLGLAGEESTGKTFYALSIARYFQEKNKNGGVFYWETEGALDKTEQTQLMLFDRGIDIDRFFLMPVTTIQEFRTQATKILEEYLEESEDERPPMLFVLDSLGNISTEKEVSDMVEGADKRDMTRAQLIRGAFRVLTLKMNRARVPMIVVNHVHDVIGSYVPLKDMGGGRGLKYAASSVLFLGKSKKKDADGNVTGAVITARVKKSRFTREEKEVETLLDHTHGLSRYYGLLEIAEAGGVAERTDKKNEIWLLPGGVTESAKNIYKNPEKYFTKEVLDQIDTAAQKLFKFGDGEVSVGVDED